MRKFSTLWGYRWVLVAVIVRGRGAAAALPARAAAVGGGGCDLVDFPKGSEEFS